MAKEKTNIEIISDLKKQHVELSLSLGGLNDEYRTKRKEIEDTYAPEIRKRNDQLADIRKQILDLEKTEKESINK